MYKKVLVPLDGSPLSEAVLPYAGSLAAGVGADVTLLHVSEPEPVRRPSSLPSKTYFAEVTHGLKQQRDSEARLR